MGFHARKIEKGYYGEASKVREELDEALESLEQNQPLMFLIELSDVLGAMAGVGARFGYTLEDVRNFPIAQAPTSYNPSTDLSVRDYIRWGFETTDKLDYALRADLHEQVLPTLATLYWFVANMATRMEGEMDSMDAMMRFAALRSKVAREELNDV